MSPRQRSVLLVLSQPAQNPRPLQLMAQHPDWDMQVAYCSLPDPQLWQGAEYLNKGVFDVPMLEGYPWQALPNRSPQPSLGRFWGLINPAVVGLLRPVDCCVVYGHAYVSFWLAIATAKLLGKPLLLSTDATGLGGAGWKTTLKRLLLPWLYNQIADGVLVPSTAAQQFLRSLGIQAERITVTPYVVDNEAIAATAQACDRAQLRATWQIPAEAVVVVFCAKLIGRKAPQDLLDAFAQSLTPVPAQATADRYLVIVGDGPLGESLRQRAEALGISDRVRFLGWVNYSQLPQVYAASDLLVHPAEHEPYGLPVNEAMICGIPVVVSDRVGAHHDLVRAGETGFVYPAGDVAALAQILRTLLGDRDTLRRMGVAAAQRMETWSSSDNAAATLQSIAGAIARKFPPKTAPNLPPNISPNISPNIAQPGPEGDTP